MSKAKKHEPPKSAQPKPIDGAAPYWNNISRRWLVLTEAGPAEVAPQPAPPTLSVRL